MKKPDIRIPDDIVITCYVAAGVVSEICNVDESEMFSRSRRDHLVFARHMLFYVMHVLFNCHYNYLQALYGWDRTTLIHAIDAIQDRLDTERDAVYKLRSIMYLLEGSR